MPNIQHRAVARNSLRTTKSPRTRRYLVPGTEHDARPKTAAIGFPSTGVLRSVRTGRGRIYGNDELRFLIAVLDQAQADGLTQAEIVIEYKRLGVSVAYSTSIATLRSQGQRVLGESGWELALPRQLWSIDGQAPEGLPEEKPTAEPEAVQVALFDYSEPRKVVYF